MIIDNIIERQWDELICQCYQGIDETSNQCRIMKQIFYAGHASLLGLIQLNKKNDLDRLLYVINDEITEFNKHQS